MLKLGVNIDHVATLREARYRGRSVGEPDPVAAALECEAAGCHGITAHLREDRRHIQDRDVWALREKITTRLNFEMAVAPEIVDIALRLKPHIVCLVPERRQEVTTEGGLDVRGNLARISEVTRKLMAAGIEVSLFIAPDPDQIRASADSGAGYLELHTGRFADLVLDGHDATAEIQRLVEGAQLAHELGLGVNAGHGLTVRNLPTLLMRVPYLEELNIGHSLVSRALTTGLAGSVKEFLAVMQDYRLGAGT